MNGNQVLTKCWSNPDSERRYSSGWPQEPHLAKMRERGQQCGTCSYYAGLNTGFGLCCHPQSRHAKETVLQHFTCPAHVDECWGPHSFTTSTTDHCACHGVELVKDSASDESANETRSLLKIISLGNRQIESDRVISAASAVNRLLAIGRKK